MGGCKAARLFSVLNLRNYVGAVVILCSREYAMFGFDRITFDPKVMGGRACMRDTRVTVSLVVNLTANGMSAADIVAAYPYLELADVQEALRYAAWLAEETIEPLMPTTV